MPYKMNAQSFARMRNQQSVHKRAKDARWRSRKVGARTRRPKRPQTQGCVIVLAQSFARYETNRASTTCKDARWRSHKAVMQGCIKTATQSRCTMQRHKWLSMHRCNGTNGCRCTDVATQTADEAVMRNQQSVHKKTSVVVLFEGLSYF